MTPVWGATAGVLGTVVASDRASVGGAGAAVGTTIFAGDNLSTADAGSMQLRAGSARFLLAASSMATVNEDGGMPGATLLRGSATFSTASAKAFALNASTAVIRPKSDEPTIGQVTMLSAKQLLVECMRGTLTITVGDDSREIAEGSAYRIVLDPGFGFGKRFEENYPLLAHFAELQQMGFPLLAGVSRKSFIGRLLARDGKDAEVGARIYGTLAAETALILKGVHIIRTHDVRLAIEAARVADAIVANGG